ncbi:MAG: hypothetical protein P8M80_13585 [Pirellulaceae bacterium]|nr:hypothetical protein [Pirellulaceae bacterium]
MRDLRKITLLAFAVLLGFGALWMKSFFDQQSLGVDGVAGYSTGQSTAEEYRIERETSEAYGQFELTIDPLRQSYALDVQTDQPLLERDFVNVLMKESINDVEITLSCHRCYPVTDVSGGKLEFTKGPQKWVLGFHHVGAEGVLYTETLPPDWVFDFSLAVVDRDSVSDRLLKQFKKVYLGQIDQNETLKNDAMVQITGILLGLVIEKFGQHTDS